MFLHGLFYLRNAPPDFSLGADDKLDVLDA